MGAWMNCACSTSPSRSPPPSTPRSSATSSIATSSRATFSSTPTANRSQSISDLRRFHHGLHGGAQPIVGATLPWPTGAGGRRRRRHDARQGLVEEMKKFGLIILGRFTLDGSGEYERLTFFSDYPGFKASNP